MKQFRPAKKRIEVSVGESVRIVRELRGLSQNRLAQLTGIPQATISATKTALFAEAGKQPGSRVLDGRILVEPIGMGVPKGRDTVAAVYVGKFVEEAKAEGLVKSAIERAGLRGVVVAPLK
ncbi:MAG: helix-turn-helix domain-containing protein [Betaproteobacteria bacterium]|nr:helix-turn-helix domain-containing protein [Betaproteobacteria bacterium]